MLLIIPLIKLILIWLSFLQGLLAAQKDDECRELVAKLHQEQMESIFQRDMLQYLIQDKVDVEIDNGIIWQGGFRIH